MEVGMSLNALVRLPLSNSRTHEGLIRHSLFSNRTHQKPELHKYRHQLMVVQAKGKRGLQTRQSTPPPLPPMPKIEDDGNPKFVIFIRMDGLYIWYPLSIVTGGTTAKIMVAAKDNFMGKYIYKNTLDRNLAGVIYREQGIRCAGMKERTTWQRKELHCLFHFEELIYDCACVSCHP